MAPTPTQIREETYSRPGIEEPGVDDTDVPPLPVGLLALVLRLEAQRGQEPAGGSIC